jgi:hypothetical protein
LGSLPASLSLLDLCCKALANLVAAEAFENRRICGELGLCESKYPVLFSLINYFLFFLFSISLRLFLAISAILREYGLNVRIAESGSRVVKNLCCNAANNKQRLGAAGACQGNV